MDKAEAGGGESECEHEDFESGVCVEDVINGEAQ